MKFSKLLDEYQLAEWKGSAAHIRSCRQRLRTYIPYYFLKKRGSQCSVAHVPQAPR